MKLPGALLCIVVLSLGAPVRAGSPVPVKMKCPVGGKSFTYTSTASMSQWGSRPDGKPYGSWTFPMPLPECPDNGLVIYREFSRDETKALKPLLATPEYTQLRGAETPYYRAYWLMGKLGDPAENQVWVLQQAAWETDDDATRKARYQEEFITRARTLAHPEAGQDDLLWIVTGLRAANALRELGRFDEALQFAESIPLASLDVVVPAEKVTGTTPSGLGKYVGNSVEIRAAQSRRSWMDYAASLKAVMARRDSSSEPLDMIPRRLALQRCEGYPTDTPEYKQVCATVAKPAEPEKPQ